MDPRGQGVGRESQLNELYLAPTSLVDAAPLELIGAAAAAGYDGIGLRLNASPGLPFHPVVGNPPLVRDVRRALGDAGLAVLDVYSFYLQPATDVRLFAPALELGAALGAKYALTMGDDPEWPRLADNFGRFCDLAAGFGLACAVEFAVMRPLASLGQSVRLVRESVRSNAVICLDPLNFVRGGGVPAEVSALEPRLFPYAQITDGVLGPGEPDPGRLGRMGPNQRRLLGEGVVPVAAILDALPADLPLSVELPPAKGARPSAAAMGEGDGGERAALPRALRAIRGSRVNELYLAPTTFPDARPLDFLTVAAAAGYDGVGIRLHRSPNLPFHPVVGDAALIRGIERALADGGLKVLDIFTFYLQPPTDVRDFTPALELGAALGAKYAVVQGDDPEWPRLRDNFAAFCDDAARLGLGVAVEFMPARPLATLALALQLRREVARSNVSIVVDPLHLARSGGTPADLGGLDPTLFPYAQFSDGIRATAERRMPGAGELPLAALLEALPRGLPLSVEVPDTRRGDVPALEWAKMALTTTRNLLAKP